MTEVGPRLCIQGRFLAVSSQPKLRLLPIVYELHSPLGREGHSDISRLIKNK